MGKNKYISSRGDLNFCFNLYCGIKGLRPTKKDMSIISTLIDPKLLHKYLDNYYGVQYIVKEVEVKNFEKKIIKIW